MGIKNVHYQAKESFYEVPIETRYLEVTFPIENFNGLELLVNITQLSISNNIIKSFKGFPMLPNLTSLFVSDNKICSFEGFPHLPKLESLHIYRNNLCSFKGITISNFKCIESNNSIYIEKDSFFEKVISRDINEHKRAFLKNENEEDVSAATLFFEIIPLYSNSLDPIIFAIKNKIHFHIFTDTLFNNIDFLEYTCSKYNNIVSNEMMNSIIRKKKIIADNNISVFF